MTAGTDTILSTPSMGRSNSTIMKWAYNTLTPKTQDMEFVQTFRENFEGFTKKEIKAAKITQKYQIMIGNPYEREYTSMAINNRIPKFPIIDYGATNYNIIFGPNLAGNRGKTVRYNQDRVVMYCVSIPNYFLNYTSLQLSWEM